jgi:hypothetical protein
MVTRGVASSPQGRTTGKDEGGGVRVEGDDEKKLDNLVGTAEWKKTRGQMGGGKVGGEEKRALVGMRKVRATRREVGGRREGRNRRKE